jgi:hypothetical protein
MLWRPVAAGFLGSAPRRACHRPRSGLGKPKAQVFAAPIQAQNLAYGRSLGPLSGRISHVHLCPSAFARLPAPLECSAIGLHVVPPSCDSQPVPGASSPGWLDESTLIRPPLRAARRPRPAPGARRVAGARAVFPPPSLIDVAPQSSENRVAAPGSAARKAPSPRQGPRALRIRDMSSSLVEALRYLLERRSIRPGPARVDRHARLTTSGT